MSVSIASPEDILRIQKKIQTYEESLRGNSFENLPHRRKGLFELSRSLIANQKLLAKTISDEMGKTQDEACAEVKKSALALDYFSKHPLPRPMQLHPLESGDFELRPEPLGWIYAIMPWNFPIWQWVRVFAPNILLGNGLLWKPSLVTAHTAKVFSDLANELGFESYFDQILLPDPEVLSVVAWPQIKAVTFTGSTRTGRLVGQACGHYLKKAVLELGGSDPFIVCESADLDQAIMAAVTSRSLNSGQSCISAKRFIIAESLYSKFKEGFLGELKKQPERSLVSQTALDQAHRQIQKFIAEGAQFFPVSVAISGSSVFTPPLGLLEVTGKEPSYSTEELFFPVGLVSSFRTIEQALALANSTVYGLGASVWTNLPQEQEFFAKHLKAGHVAVNDFTRSDPGLPFGGLADSGFGKELGSLGLLEFCHFKVVKKQSR